VQLIATQPITRQPDIFIQISVPNEFQAPGKYNIGITAGIETTAVPAEWIEGCNKMNMIITTSEHSKKGFIEPIYDILDKNTNQKTGELKLQKPIKVLFEGIDTNIYKQTKDVHETVLNELSDIKDTFCYLFVGHWLKGDLGQDRKDIGMAIKTFATVFQYLPKDKRPALIVKTSHAGFSVIDREATREKIDGVLKSFGDKCPSVYLLHGDMEETDMSNLYHHPKVKAMISFAKGEGYGRPMAEFTLTGKPIIASGWSGQMDFLPPDNAVLLEGNLTPVHESAADQFCMKEAQWFTANYSNAANKIYDVYNNYNTYLQKSAGLKENTLKNFTLDKMNEKFEQILNTYVKEQPKLVPFNMPTVNSTKMQIPKLNKI
jgi:glycosyltransferase involved in cell wall biosynthesis